MTEIPWFSCLPALTGMEQLPVIVLKKTGLTCASSIAVPAPGVGLPEPLENEEQQLHTPLVLKFILDFPIKSKKC